MTEGKKDRVAYSISRVLFGYADQEQTDVLFWEMRPASAGQSTCRPEPLWVPFTSTKKGIIFFFASLFWRLGNGGMEKWMCWSHSRSCYGGRILDAGSLTLEPRERRENVVWFWDAAVHLRVCLHLARSSLRMRKHVFLCSFCFIVHIISLLS